MSTPTFEPPAEPEALIIGLGNLLLTDEGVGVQVLRRLEQEFAFSPAVRLVDGGTTGLDLLDLFQEHRRILLIDALVAQDSPPGSILVLQDEAILATISKKLSMHHLGIRDVLALAKLLDYAPEEIIMIGVVPESLELGTELSSTVTQRLADILDEVRTILASWSITLSPKTI